MNLKNSLLFFTFSLLSIDGMAHSSMHQFAWRVHENLMNRENFTLRLKVEGTLFHRGSEVFAEFREDEFNGKKCGELVIKGHGELYHDFRSELEDWEKANGTPFLEDFFKVHQHERELAATICYREKGKSEDED